MSVAENRRKRSQGCSRIRIVEHSWRPFEMAAPAFRSRSLEGVGFRGRRRMPDRFDKFTQRARRVLTFAQEEAQRFNHNYIGTEHLLLGLVREGEGVAARVLTSMGVDLELVRTQVERIVGRG